MGVTTTPLALIFNFNPGARGPLGRKAAGAMAPGLTYNMGPEGPSAW